MKFDIIVLVTILNQNRAGRGMQLENQDIREMYLFLKDNLCSQMEKYWQSLSAVTQLHKLKLVKESFSKVLI